MYTSYTILRLPTFTAFLLFVLAEKKETLFRGNTLATKLMDQFMKMVAIPYLQKIIKPVILKIMESRQNCEVRFCVSIRIGKRQKLLYPSSCHL